MDSSAFGTEDVQAAAKLRLSIRTGKGIDKYPAKSHAQRVGAKLGLDKCLVVLQGQKNVLLSNSDQPRPFRQDRYFYYLTGCNEPGCYVTYDTAKDKLKLWLPSISFKRVFYDGRGSTIEEAMELYDIDEAAYISTNVVGLTDLMRKHHDAGGRCMFMSTLTVLDTTLRATLKGSGTPGPQLREAMDACRAVKDEHEIALIRQANAVTAEAHTNVFRSLHRLTSESEVEGVYQGTCFSLGSQHQAYHTIIGSGPNASQLHYNNNKQKFDDRQVLLVDCGAEWQCYASDVTRTMPINPRAPGTWQSKEAEAVYDHVARIQEECISMLQPGKHFVDVSMHAVHMAIDALLDLGILKGDHTDIFDDGTYAAFHPHGVGHHLGLEVHDVFPPVEGGSAAEKAQFNRMRLASRTTLAEPLHLGINPLLYWSSEIKSDAPLAPGMILTVEPGLYFNNFFLETFYLNNPKHSKYIDKDVLGRFMHVGGVRIEDDILITKDGHENLTTTPKGDDMLRIIQEAARDHDS